MWIEKLDNGKFKYVERYTDPYTEKIKKVSVTLNSKSNQAKKQAQKELQHKIDIRISKDNSSKTTFGDLLSEWLLYYPNTVKDRTFTNYKYPIKKIEAYFDSDILIKHISPKYVKEFITELYYKKNYSLNYVKTIKNCLSSIFEFAVDSEYLENNPVKKVRIKEKPIELDQLESTADKYLEKDELKCIIKCQGSKLYGERNALFTEFLALTGLRFGEAVSLTVNQFDGTSVSVRATLDYISSKSSDAKLTAPKTKKSIRTVELPTRAINIINLFIAENEFKALTDKYNDRGFIFTTSSGNPIIISNYNHSLKNAALKCGIKKDVTSHILRHTHISLLAELGIPLKAIMDRVGHQEASTTLKIYTHVTDSMKQNVTEKLNSLAPFSPLLSN